MLHCFRSVGGGCGHMLFGTIAVFPSVTSCMQLTSRIWSPMPQLCEHGWKSLTFHRGGQGWSLHVCVSTSGWSFREHKYGETIFLSSSRTHSTNDSCTPIHQQKNNNNRLSKVSTWWSVIILSSSILLLSLSKKKILLTYNCTQLEASSFHYYKTHNTIYNTFLTEINSGH